MWKWLKSFGKGAAAAAPTILDVASIAMPGPAAAAAHKSADVIREIRQQRELSAATPPINPIPAQLLGVVEQVVSEKQAYSAVVETPSAIVPVQLGGNLAERVKATQEYIALLERVIALEQQLNGGIK